MPHLTADALRDDPEGLAFLRGVLKPGRRERAGAAPEAAKPEIAEPVRLPRPARPARPAEAGRRGPLKSPNTRRLLTMITSTLPRTIGAAAAATALAALALASIPQASAATRAEPTAAVVDVKAPAVPGARTAVAEAEDATTCARPRRKLWIEGQGWVVRRVHAC